MRRIPLNFFAQSFDVAGNMRDLEGQGAGPFSSLIVICWVILASLVLGRLLFRPSLPDLLLPTIAIEVAPAAVASIAWFAMNGGKVGPVVTGLAGYGLLMVVAQLRLLPMYLRLRFMPTFWGFTFSWAVVASATLLWADVGVKGGTARDVETYLLLAAITLLIVAIAIRTLIAIARGTLLPPPVHPVEVVT